MCVSELGWLEGTSEVITLLSPSPLQARAENYCVRYKQPTRHTRATIYCAHAILRDADLRAARAAHQQPLCFARPSLLRPRIRSRRAVALRLGADSPSPPHASTAGAAGRPPPRPQPPPRQHQASGCAAASATAKRCTLLDTPSAVRPRCGWMVSTLCIQLLSLLFPERIFSHETIETQRILTADSLWKALAGEGTAVCSPRPPRPRVSHQIVSAHVRPGGVARGFSPAASLPRSCGVWSPACPLVALDPTRPNDLDSAARKVRLDRGRGVGLR